MSYYFDEYGYARTSKKLPQDVPYDQWAPQMWNQFNDLAKNFKSSQDFASQVHSLISQIPCPECKSDGESYVKTNPPESVTSKSAAQSWVQTYHNHVNQVAKGWGDYAGGGGGGGPTGQTGQTYVDEQGNVVADAGGGTKAIILAGAQGRGGAGGAGGGGGGSIGGGGGDPSDPSTAGTPGMTPGQQLPNQFGPSNWNNPQGSFPQGFGLEGNPPAPGGSGENMGGGGGGPEGLPGIGCDELGRCQPVSNFPSGGGQGFPQSYGLDIKKPDYRPVIGNTDTDTGYSRDLNRDPWYTTMWSELHEIAYDFNPETFSEDIYHQIEQIPSENERCYVNSLEFIRNNPPEYVRTRDQAMYWMCRFHNHASLDAGNGLVDCELDPEGYGYVSGHDDYARDFFYGGGGGGGKRGGSRGGGGQQGGGRGGGGGGGRHKRSGGHGRGGGGRGGGGMNQQNNMGPGPGQGYATNNQSSHGNPDHIDRRGIGGQDIHLHNLPINQRTKDQWGITAPVDPRQKGLPSSIGSQNVYPGSMIDETKLHRNQPEWQRPSGYPVSMTMDKRITMA